MVILALLDASPSARPVLEAGIRLAEVLDAPLEAVHARTWPGSERSAADLAARRGVHLRLVEGPVTESLLDDLCREGVEVGVIGARGTESGRRPVGRVTRTIIEHSSCPVLVVPPESVDPPPLRTALVPLEGTVGTSAPLDAWVPRLADLLRLVALHVFTPETVPAMLDRPVRDMAMIADTFLERNLPAASRVEMRSGHVAGRIVEACRRDGVDMVILSWLQSGVPGRARTVLEVLTLNPLPTLLLPAGPRPGGRRGAGTARASRSSTA